MSLDPQLYPDLAKEGYSIESDMCPAYNCVAWATGSDSEWWDPLNYWPPSVPRGLTVDAFILLFEHLGYTICESRVRETGFEKVAIYGLYGAFKHVARQLRNGRWTSKLGKNVDILHTLKGLEGPFYGQVDIVLKREL